MSDSGVRGLRSDTSHSPLRRCLFFLVGHLVACVASFLFRQGSGSFFGIYTVGDDFRDFFYRAAGDWLTTGSPYRHLFVAPPPSVLPAMLLHGFAEPVAHALYSLLTVLLMALALWRFGRAAGLTPRNRAGLLAAAATFIPMWLLVSGGNTDGLMLAGLLLAYSARSRIGRALGLALTMVVKVYSAVLLVAALRRREFRFVAATLIFCLLALLPFYRLVPEMVHQLFFRTGFVQVSYNISPAQLFYLALHRFGAAAWKLPYAAGWLAAFAYTLWRSRGESGPATLATYAPFMISAPMLVLAYSGVIALPIFAVLLAAAQQRRLYPYEWAMLAGFLLLDFHPEFVVAYGSYTTAAFAAAKLAAAVAGALGTTILLFTTVARVRAQARAPQGATAAAVTS